MINGKVQPAPTTRHGSLGTESPSGRMSRGLLRITPIPATLFAAGGFSHSQYLGDIVAMLQPPGEDELVRLLGGRHAGG
jgi:hypothetical protein